MFRIEIILLTNNIILPWQNLQKSDGLSYIELNKLFATASLAEHGLGFLINIWELKDEVSSSKEELVYKLIFDTGSSNLTYLHNLDLRGYMLYDVDKIILSHWHYDHTGGLYKILQRIEKRIEIICHPNAKKERFFIRSREILPQNFIGKERKTINPLILSSKIVNQEPINLDKVNKLNGTLNLARNQIEIFNKDDLRIIVSSEIPRNVKEEEFNNFICLDNGKITLDKIWDDKFIIFEFLDRCVLVNGCCHAGIMNTLNYVKENINKPVTHIIGGFHMANSSFKRIRSTLDYLENFQNERLDLFPIHCSGQGFINAIKSMKSTKVYAYNVSVGTIFNFFSNQNKK